ncbi:uncharacterized protein LOC122244796 [Penaeus japonicus]|uniref:uncharacterized protein LOC122244796 n=1 Tax=Penaeus japonicus TaxID=27405 RepID=UPI001C70E140|nr:uncharacterized protein LOC122244796 [Penaeus japonicus]XP_042858705.1 uncharacterized protein LOC122244796 [Penaeus japonicus]
MNASEGNKCEEEGGGGEEEGRWNWFRPANVSETFFEACQRHGLIMTAYWLVVSSASPLEEEHVRLALCHLYRKVPTLRLCLRQRDGVLWACERAVGDNIDFEVVEGRDPRDVMEEVMNQSYASHDGPLWRARLVRGAAGEDCPSEELRASFPHTSHLVLGNHHGIADGTSNVRTYNLLLRILNDVIAGRPIDDQEQLGDFVNEAELMKMVDDKKRALEKDPENLQRLLEEKAAQMQRVPLFLQCHPPAGQRMHRRTRMLHGILDEETTRRLIERCKREGVSVESAVTTAINGTTVDMAVRTGREAESFRLSESHAVNLRRYLSADAAAALGVLITVFDNVTQTPITWRAAFWEHARSLHASLHARLRQNGPLHDECLRQMVMPNDALETLLTDLPSPTHDCTTSNMGALDAKFPERGAHVQATRLARGSCSFYDFAVHFYHTFRGRFTYTLCFDAGLVAEDVASAFRQALFDNLKAVI